MTTLPLYRIDAFAEAVFEGNPAAVCLLSSWPGDDTLQAIAAENNLSETAFVIPRQDPVPLRWFTPRQEVPLCGHATLAAGYVILTFVRPERQAVAFATRSGTAGVSRRGDGFALDFPAVRAEPTGALPAALLDGLGVVPLEVLRTSGDPNYLVILHDESEIRAIEPDLRQLESLHPQGVAVSAPGEEVDFVSRYFAPSYGIPEDPVTGSIHCALGPYWGERIGRRLLTARQLSERGGTIRLELEGDRVRLIGNAVCYSKGDIHLSRSAPELDP